MHTATDSNPPHCLALFVIETFLRTFVYLGSEGKAQQVVAHASSKSEEFERSTKTCNIEQWCVQNECIYIEW